MKVKKGEVFTVINSVTLRDRNIANAGFITTKKHELGEKFISPVCFFAFAQASAIRDITFCPRCCIVYGETFPRCEDHISS